MSVNSTTENSEDVNNIVDDVSEKIDLKKLKGLKDKMVQKNSSVVENKKEKAS